RDEHDEVGPGRRLVHAQPRLVEQTRELGGESARAEHDGAARGGRWLLGQQAGGEACQQLIALPRRDLALGGEHPEPRGRDALREGGDEPFLAAGEFLEHRDRRVDAELQGVQIAPDEGDRRVETQHHVPSLPGERPERRSLSTAVRGYGTFAPPFTLITSSMTKLVSGKARNT